MCNPASEITRTFQQSIAAELIPRAAWSLPNPADTIVGKRSDNHKYSKL